tara:strand:+ start:2036 stop:2464 length:429 start_codon:yes stop_codon:yes gene_type:complete
MTRGILVLAVLGLSGCAGVDFNADENGAVYYEPLPYLFYSVTDKCISSATVVSLPGKKRHLDFSSGYGSSSLSAEFSNGLLTKVGQTSDSKIPETLTSIAGLKTAGVLAEGATAACKPKAVLFPIENGVPNLQKQLDLNVGQ